MFSFPRFATHLLASLVLGAPLLVVSTGRVAATAAPLTVVTAASDYQQVTLAFGAPEMGEAMALAVLPDRSVLHTARDGTVRITDAQGNTNISGRIPVYDHDEDGLQGVGVDPNFAANRALYLYYSPPLSTPGTDAPANGTAAAFAPFAGVNRLSRFILNANGTLNMASEKAILEVRTDRGMCCHNGGDIDFDAAGNLYLSTGDDTNPYQSDGYSPLDERTDRYPAFDAQRSAANTNDLRGKVLRIKVNVDGSYSIPPGNLFAPGTAGTRPEIYAMGLRNPFRMSVDKATGILYLGDFGPDAGVADPNRGPGGQVEVDRITSAGNYGWPYCTGTNTTAETYNHFDFATEVSGPKYNCAAPVNTSPRNTGLVNLPPARPSWIKYGDAGSPPEFGSGSESPMGGPVYRYDAANPSPVKFPQSLDGVYFAGEYGRQWIKTVEVNADGTPGAIGGFPWRGTQVMDLAFGPDGALYVLDYGTGFGLTANSGLYRIEYSPGGRAPIARAAADRTSGTGPLPVAFSSAGSSDPEGGPLSYAWSFGDGGTSSEANPAHTYATNGQYTATLTVTDVTAKTATAGVIVTVGNTAPTVNLTLPADGQLFSFGDTVPFRVSVTDPEETSIDCARVRVTYLLGHDQHGHQITSTTGCTGQITVPADGGHNPAANVYGVFDAEYTDSGANGQPALTTHTQHILPPRSRQAEHLTAASGVQLEVRASAHGSQVVGFIGNGSWIAFRPYLLSNATSFSARIASGGVGGRIEVRADGPTGTLLGTATVPVTGGWDQYRDVASSLVSAPAATTTLYLVFAGGAGFLFNVDDFRFTTGPGIPVEAEAYASQSGVQPAVHAGASSGRTVGYVDNGDWTAYPGVSTANVRTFSARVSSGGAGGRIEVRTGSATGTLLGSVAVPNTGSWDTFTVVSTLLAAGPPGPLFLVYRGGVGFLFDVDSFALTAGRGGPGVFVGIGGKCVDVAAGNSANGTPIVLWDCNGNPDQQWTVSPDGTVRSLGKCLDVSGYGTANGSLTHLWDCAPTPTANQVWVAQLDGSLMNPVSGRCLDAVGVSSANGTRLHLWDCYGGSNQRWQMP